MHNPWDILELEPGASEGDIRKAYARKLKTIRPDEKPQEFQQLREARDLALTLAAAAATGETAGSGPGYTVKMTFVPGNAYSPGTAQFLRAKTGNRPGPGQNREPPDKAENTPDGQPPAQPEPAALPQTGVELPDETPAGAEEFTLRDLENLLQRRPSAKPADAGTWSDILKGIERLALRDRSAAEPPVIAALHRAITDTGIDTLKEALLRRAAPQGLSWSDQQRFTELRRAASARYRPFFNTMLALDKEFGWELSDRQFHLVNGDRNSRALLVQLFQTLRSAEASTSGELLVDELPQTVVDPKPAAAGGGATTIDMVIINMIWICAVFAWPVLGVVVLAVYATKLIGDMRSVRRDVWIAHRRQVLVRSVVVVAVVVLAAVSGQQRGFVANNQRRPSVAAAPRGTGTYKSVKPYNLYPARPDTPPPPWNAPGEWKRNEPPTGPNGLPFDDPHPFLERFGEPAPDDNPFIRVHPIPDAP